MATVGNNTNQDYADARDAFSQMESLNFIISVCKIQKI